MIFHIDLMKQLLHLHFKVGIEWVNFERRENKTEEKERNQSERSIIPLQTSPGVTLERRAFTSHCSFMPDKQILTILLWEQERAFRDEGEDFKRFCY